MIVRRGLIDLRPLASSAAFRRLWAGTSLSGIGHQITVVAVLYQVWEMTRSPVWTGTIGIAHAVPMIVLGLAGGVLADSVDRRSLVRWATLGQFLAVLGLAGQALSELESLPLVLALVAVQSGFSALGAPARRTFPTRLLVRDQVSAGIALQHLSFQVAMLVGPALAGVVIAAWGLTVCYLIDAAAVLIALYAVLRLPSLPPLGERQRAGFRSVIEGARFVRRASAVGGSLAVDLVATVMAMPVALFPMVNEIRFGGRPETLGLFLSAVAVGGILAGLAAGTVTRADRNGRIQLGGALVWGLALAGFGLAAPLWLALGLLAVAGAADTISVISRGTMVQLATPDSHRGRVSSVEHVIGVAGPDVGNFRAGLVAGLASPVVALVSGGLACVVGVLLIGARNRALREFRTSQT